MIVVPPSEGKSGVSRITIVGPPGIVLGIGYVVMGFVVTRSVVGTSRAMCAASLYAIGPFYLRCQVCTATTQRLENMQKE